MYQQRINALQEWMRENQIETAYLNHPNNISYFTGFDSEPHERILALFVSANHEPFLFTPGLDAEDAKRSGWNYDVESYLDSENPWAIIRHAFEKRHFSVNHLAIEKDNLSVAHFDAFSDQFSNVQVKADLTPFIQRQMLIKTDDEKQLMIEAGDWADVAFEVAFNAIKEGVKEFEILAEIEYQLKLRGVSSMSFDTIVLAGENAASPHGVPSDNTVKPNEFVLFDLGVLWKGYCSDATRTVSYKEPTAHQEKIYNIVLQAQLEAEKAIKPGITAGELDKIARDVITEAGYGEYFNHRLGHGIGTSVHEFPSLVEGNDMVIEKGMCFSIEPGIYIPGDVGVRIEDCYYVTEDGALPFTQTPKSLQIIE